MGTKRPVEPPHETAEQTAKRRRHTSPPPPPKKQIAFEGAFEKRLREAQAGGVDIDARELVSILECTLAYEKKLKEFREVLTDLVDAPWSLGLDHLRHYAAQGGKDPLKLRILDLIG